MGRFSRAVWLYIGVIVAAAVFVIGYGPLHGIEGRRLAVLAGLFLVCESTPTAILPRQVAWWPG